MEQQQEMTLRQFLATLPASHLAWRQFNKLRHAAKLALDNLSEVPGRERQWACEPLEKALLEIRS